MALTIKSVGGPKIAVSLLLVPLECCNCSAASIEEVWRKKPRQTDVAVLWGKFAAHNMLLFRP